MRVFEKLIPALSETLKAEGSMIIGPEKLPVKRDHFKPLLASIGPQMAFLDGGNGEILRGPNVSIQFIRLYATLYRRNVRAEKELREHVLVVLLQEQTFHVTVLDMDGNEQDKYAFDAFDPVLCFGKRRAEAYAVANHVRKLLEVKMAVDWCSKLSAGDVLVRDGDLEKDGETFSMLMKELQSVAQAKDIVVCGLSKTTTLVTNTGASAVSALRQLAPEGAWVYYTGGALSFVKLHPKAKYIFRCDVLPHNKLEAAWSALAANAIDPALLGYPYGLLEADKFAQVTKHELAQLRVRFAVMSKDAFKGIESAVDAHDILDSL